MGKVTKFVLVLATVSILAYVSVSEYQKYSPTQRPYAPFSSKASVTSSASTHTPAPTSTPTPLFYGKSITYAAEAAAFSAKDSVVKYVRAWEEGSAAFIRLKLDGAHSVKNLGMHAVLAAIDISDTLFRHPDAETISLEYVTPMVDKYGHAEDAVVMTILVTRITHDKWDSGYLKTLTLSDAKRASAAFDVVWVSPTYSDMLYSEW